jgi:flavin-dependent dehydrogenase
MADVAVPEYDVVVMGGGLAGLCLARQIKRARPETSILVAEKRKGPAREAAHKVGESTSESSAHYYAEVLGLKEHLLRDQLHKFGLRFFWPAGDNSDIARRCEFGALEDLAVVSYQLDRGRFENHLAAENDRLGIERLDGARVKEIALGGDVHTITLERDEQRSTVTGRWLVDAAGRAALLKRQLGLEKDFEHTINSAWFRLDGGLDIETFSDDPAWRDLELGPGMKITPGARHASTNHLMGEGYWVWLIPLASGPISIGIVADPRFHPLEEYDTFDKAMDWLRRHEPQVADALRGREDQIIDFLKVGDFAHSAQRVYGPDRWVLTGDAGVFLDPFYSPGSDFIGYSNTLITDLITRDLDGEPVDDRLDSHSTFITDMFETLHLLYNGQYTFFGNAAIAFPKIVWDACWNWSVVSLLFHQNQLANTELRAAVADDLDRAHRLHAAVQRLFREWHALETRRFEGHFLLPPPLFAELNERLLEKLDDAGLQQRIHDNVDALEAFSVGLFHKAAQLLPDPPDPTVPVNPYAVSLRPDDWDAEGLFDEPGLTYDQVIALTEGFESLFVDEYDEENVSG